MPPGGGLSFFSNDTGLSFRRGRFPAALCPRVQLEPESWVSCAGLGAMGNGATRPSIAFPHSCRNYPLHAFFDSR